MSEREVIVNLSGGLHARPAALFVRAVARCGRPVSIGRAGQPEVDAGSLLAVLTMGIEPGEPVILSTTGPDADAVLQDLARLLEADPALEDST